MAKSPNTDQDRASRGSTGLGVPGIPSMEDLAQLMEKFKMPGIDVNAFMEWQRKDLEALAEANRAAYDGYKSLIQRRNEILQEAFVDWQSRMQGMLDPSAMTRQTEAARESMQRAVDNFRELTEMEAEARQRAWKIMQERLQENMEQLQALLNPGR